jgi:hypothetical protein
VTFHADDYYALPAHRMVALGAIFRDIPVLFQSRRSLPEFTADTRGRAVFGENFTQAWPRVPQRLAEAGLPVAALAKGRPVIVLRIGELEEDDVHARDLWVAPLYSSKDRPRQGPNLFPLPPWPAVGLPLDGFVDFYQVGLVPVRFFHHSNYACRLQPVVFTALLAAFSQCVLAVSTPGS